MLRRDHEEHLAARTLLDGADVALWCALAHDDADSTEDIVIPTVALAAEAGARHGLGAIAVIGVHAAIAATVRRARGHRLRLEQFSWPTIGAIGGWTVAALARRRRVSLHALHDEELLASIQTAELAGLHDVVTEHEGPIDELQRATALIELSLPGRHRRQDFAGAFKAEVAATARASSIYLRDALLVWQTRHNAQPTLAAAAMVALDGDDGTVMLNDAQRDQLFTALESLEMRGRVDVRLADPVEARRPNGARDLVVQGVPVSIPSVEDARSWRFDAIPAAFVVNLGFLLQPSGAEREAVPLDALGVPITLSGLAAIWSSYRAERSGGTSPATALAMSFAVTLSYTRVANRAMRHPFSADGTSRFPWVMPLQGYEIVRNLVDDDLDPAWRAAGGVGALAIVAVGYWSSPPPRSATALLAELQWAYGMGRFAHRLNRAIRDDADTVAAEIRAADAVALDEAYERGRARASRTVSEALDHARGLLVAAGDELDPVIAEEACRRLDHVDVLLAPRA